MAHRIFRARSVRRLTACLGLLLGAWLVVGWALPTTAQTEANSVTGTWMFDDQGGIIKDKPVIAKAEVTMSGDSLSGTLYVGDGTDHVGASLKEKLGETISITGERNKEVNLVEFRIMGGKLTKGSLRFDKTRVTGNLSYEGGPFLGIPFYLKRGGPAPAPAAAPTTLLDVNPFSLEITTREVIEFPLDTAGAVESKLPAIFKFRERLGRRGAAADGMSMLLIAERVKEPGSAKLTLPSGAAMGGLLQPFGTKPDFSLWRQGKSPGSNTVTVRTLRHGSEHYVMALYVPPATFDESLAKGRKIAFDTQGKMDAQLAPGSSSSLAGDIAARRVEVTVEFRGDSGGGSKASPTRKLNIEVVRPPVVLVHGTYDAPYECWDTPWLGGRTMVQRLQEHGFQVRLADYRNNNGKGNRGPSHFEDNKQAVWTGERDTLNGQRDAEVAGTDVAKFGPVHSHTGGIATTLASFREHGFAAAQVDVVAHSLGGVLTRVHASQHYNPGYQAPANFNQGDIRRIVTISTTHFGSDCERPVVKYPTLPMILMNHRTSGDVKATTDRTEGIMRLSMIDQALGHIAPLAVDMVSGTSTGAFEDQTPNSPALRLIGPTQVPAHAIACVCSSEDLDGIVEAGKIPAGIFEATPSEQEIQALRKFEDDYRMRLGLAFFVTPDDVFETTLPANQREDAQRMICLRNSLERDFSDYTSWWTRTGAVRGLRELKVGNSPLELEKFIKNAVVEVGLVEDFYQRRGTAQHPFYAKWTSRRYWELVRMYRAIVFGCCENDCTVRKESSLCGMTEGTRGTTVIRRALHGYAPAYAAVKDRVVELLLGDLGQFRVEGFPAAGPPAGQAIDDINDFNKRLDDFAEMTDLRVDDLVGQETDDAIRWLEGTGLAPALEYTIIADVFRLPGDGWESAMFRTKFVIAQDQVVGAKTLPGASIRLRSGTAKELSASREKMQEYCRPVSTAAQP